MCISRQYLNSDEQSRAQENTIANAARADFSRFIEPADTEVFIKIGARSFYVEQRKKMIPKLFFT